jgi:hypothetical protein
MKARLQNWWLAATTMPLLALNPDLRSFLFEARLFCRNLPMGIRGPLLEALARLTPDQLPGPACDEPTVRRLSDLAALLERRSPLGLCLRRSLTRYYFLRRIGVPVVLQFGARFVAGKPDREVTGHAWLTLNGSPYYEFAENYQGFAVMFSFPVNRV